jgi:hypothetical protein
MHGEPYMACHATHMRHSVETTVARQVVNCHLHASTVDRHRHSHWMSTRGKQASETKAGFTLQQLYDRGTFPVPSDSCKPVCNKLMVTQPAEKPVRRTPWYQ